MVGSGLDAGTTDFGPSTEGMAGGSGGFGTGSARSTGAGPQSGEAPADAGAAATAGPGPGGGEGMYAAGGNSTLNTGRPTQSDTRGAIGGGAENSSIPGSRSTHTTDDTAATAPNLIPGTTGAAESNEPTDEDPREALRRQTEEARRQMSDKATE